MDEQKQYLWAELHTHVYSHLLLKKLLFVERSCVILTLCSYDYWIALPTTHFPSTDRSSTLFNFRSESVLSTKILPAKRIPSANTWNRSESAPLCRIKQYRNINRNPTEISLLCNANGSVTHVSKASHIGMPRSAAVQSKAAGEGGQRGIHSRTQQLAREILFGVNQSTIAKIGKTRFLSCIPYCIDQMQRIIHPSSG